VMVANGDADKRIALLEFGWTTDARPGSPYAWHAVAIRSRPTTWCVPISTLPNTGVPGLPS